MIVSPDPFPTRNRQWENNHWRLQSAKCSSVLPRPQGVSSELRNIVTEQNKLSVLHNSKHGDCHKNNSKASKFSVRGEWLKHGLMMNIRQESPEQQIFELHRCMLLDMVNLSAIEGVFVSWLESKIMTWQQKQALCTVLMWCCFVYFQHDLQGKLQLRYEEIAKRFVL